MGPDPSSLGEQTAPPIQTAAVWLRYRIGFLLLLIGPMIVFVLMHRLASAR